MQPFEIKNFKAPSWNNVISTDNEESVWWEFLFFAGLNGGYYEIKNNILSKWQENGSGSVALLNWIKRYQGSNLFKEYENYSDMETALLPIIHEQPYYQTRLQLCFELLNNRAALSKLVSSCITENSVKFDYKTLLKLGKLYPMTFGEDPFFKKASLFFLFLSGWYEGKGYAVTNKLLIPADYQIPRALTYLGFISPMSKLHNNLVNRVMMDVNSQEVVDYRSAAIVICEQLAKENDIPAYKIDNYLFTVVKNDPQFRINALPEMVTNSLWF
jgi:hypothetical protein